MKRLFLLQILSLYFMACPKSDVVGPTTPSNPIYIVPLSISNKWIQSITKYDSLGNVLSSYIDTLQFPLDTIVSNVHWFHRFREDNAFANVDSGFVIRLLPLANNPDAFWQYKYPTIKGERYPFPSFTHATFGDEWFVDTVLHSIVLSIDSLITVPAGSFHCIVYQTIFNDTTKLNKTIDFLAPGFGPIRTEIYQSYNFGKNIYLFGSIVSTAIIIK